MQILKNLQDRCVNLYRSRWFNKYSIAALLFVAWMCFFDKHNVMTQWQLYSTVKEMKYSKSEYQELLVNAIDAKKDIELNKERYAREKYYMHKADEDVFIITRD